MCHTHSWPQYLNLQLSNMYLIIKTSMSVGYSIVGYSTIKTWLVLFSGDPSVNTTLRSSVDECETGVNVIRWDYCITLKFREHFIFALIRESAWFAKFKCSWKLSAGPELSETFYGLKIGQIGAELRAFKVSMFGLGILELQWHSIWYHVVPHLLIAAIENVKLMVLFMTALSVYGHRLIMRRRHTGI